MDFKILADFFFPMCI